MLFALAGLSAAIAAPDQVARLHLGVGVPDILGGSVAVTALWPLQLEAGGATGFLYKTGFVRAGGSPLRADLRGADGVGLLVEGVALGGWRWLRGEYDSATSGGPELALAAEASWWLAPHLALDVQLLGGGGVWLGKNNDGSVAPFMDGRLSVGLAF